MKIQQKGVKDTINYPWPEEKVHDESLKNSFKPKPPGFYLKILVYLGIITF